MTLRTENLGKRYGEDKWGIRDVSLQLDDGIHGLLGPNGAGKSTLMNVLTTVMEPTTGTAYWQGEDITTSPNAVRSVLGYLPQDFDVYPDLTLEEFLEYMAALRGLDSETASARIEEMITLTNLNDVRSRKLKAFSGGMRQRAGIAQALLNDPDLLIADEPTVGLDPEERVRLRSALSNTADGRVVILSTHIVPDVEATANKIAILDNGQLLTHTGVENLVERVAGEVYECLVPRANVSTLREQYQVCSTVQRSDGVAVRLVATTPPTDNATQAAPTLEDAYLKTIDQQPGV
ncbi:MULTISPECIES: ABC transporter ATP-binding protein [Halobacterium]|uniref:ABC-type transport system ATP-binding protein n=2 Tax=Halobacterium salinarum TaxID=2242 RepID=B0RA00_HALS3|nr:MULTISPECIES: ABC transporter ATP-binding protein [Halobacterium]MBB6090859.1 ABC-type multidrug transport system ATPase subunit [Halobacterium salinarum]MDL0137924.1 ABC transporter ATP-binding protein [Halobacterium salinarum]QRY21501.1 ABC transporter ATP-binding protein [Halobacterium sp. GSL-19]QRY26099.1 ABC transporter ATP-binding protein [Halobacterium sp. BOL4-2]UEB93143.1 ABC transporter ATP-binding protein [Halobacterium salinarum NRC-34001]